MEGFSNEVLAQRLNELQRDFILLKKENEVLVERFQHIRRGYFTKLSFAIFLALALVFTSLVGWIFITQPIHNIETHQFTLKDKSGNVRALFDVNSKGDPMLSLYDQNQKNLLQIYAGHDGTAGMSIFDTMGKIRLKLRSGTTEAAALTVYDRKGQKRTDLGIGNDKWTGLRVFDDGGQMRIDNALRPDGSAILVIYDQEGNPLLHVPSR